MELVETYQKVHIGQDYLDKSQRRLNETVVK